MSTLDKVIFRNATPQIVAIERLVLKDSITCYHKKDQCSDSDVSDD